MDHLSDVVEEHLAEGPFLWQRWERDLIAFDRGPDETFSFSEDRLLGHIDGLRPLLSSTLEEVSARLYVDDDPWAPAFAAFLLAESSSQDARAALTAALYAATPERAISLGRGLRLARAPSLLQAFDASLPLAPPHIQTAILGLAYDLKQPANPHVWSIANGGDQHARAALVRLLRFARATASGATVAVTLLDKTLGSSKVVVRNAAIETGLVLGEPAALSFARDLIARGDPGAGPLLPLLACLVPDGDVLAAKALGHSELQRDAVQALGYAGTAAAAQTCVEALAQELQPVLASEAFAAITGFVLPPPAEAGPDDAPAAETFDNPELSMPVADVPTVIAWWNTNRSRFVPGARHLGGRPRTWAVVHDALLSGPMRRRPALAFELLVRSHGLFDIDVTDFVINQRRHLLACAAAQTELQRSPLARSFSQV